MIILVVGLGSIGLRHLINFHGINPGARMYALRTRNRDIEKVALEAGLGKIPSYIQISTISQAVEIQPDIVVISNPSSLHAESIKFFYENTKAIICVEKPCVTSADQISTLENISRDQRVIVMQQLRFNSMVKVVNNVLNSKELGNLLSFNLVNSEHIKNWHPWESFYESYAVKSSLGGGSFLTQNHELDLAHYLFGRPSKIKTFLGSGGWKNVECDHNYSSIIKYEGNNTFIGNIRVDYYGIPAKKIAQFNFLKGEIIIDFLHKKSVIKINGEVMQEIVGESRNEQYMAMSKAVCDHYLNRGQMQSDQRLLFLDEGLDIYRYLFESIN